MLHYSRSQVCVDAGCIAVCHNPGLCRYLPRCIMPQPRFLLILAVLHYATTQVSVDTCRVALCHNPGLCRYDARTQVFVDIENITEILLRMCRIMPEPRFVSIHVMPYFATTQVCVHTMPQPRFEKIHVCCNILQYRFVSILSHNPSLCRYWKCRMIPQQILCRYRLCRIMSQPIFVSIQAISHYVTTHFCIYTGCVALCHNPFLCQYRLCRIMSQPIFVSIEAMSHDATTNFVSIQAMSHYVTTQVCVDAGYVALCHNQVCVHKGFVAICHDSGLCS